MENKALIISLILFILTLTAHKFGYDYVGMGTFVVLILFTIWRVIRGMKS